MGIFSMFRLLRNYNVPIRKLCIPPPRKMSSLVWIDLEMTGLDVKKDKIMEVACLITDKDLNIVAEGPNLVIHQSDEVLDGMNEWCRTTHGKTGLTEECRKSTISITDAENLLLTFVKKHTGERESPLAGNSVYVDRIFLMNEMPILNEYIHYRIVDVSSIKELCKRWNSKIFHQVPKKKLVHRGLEDIKESIEELKYYKKFMFIS